MPRICRRRAARPRCSRDDVEVAVVVGQLQARDRDRARADVDDLEPLAFEVVDGQPVLDLDYKEDFAATVDMNVVMTGSGQFIEIQGTGEESTFSEDQLTAMLGLARSGIRELTELQRKALGDAWPF